MSLAVAALVASASASAKPGDPPDRLSLKIIETTKEDSAHNSLAEHCRPFDRHQASHSRAG